MVERDSQKALSSEERWRHAQEGGTLARKDIRLMLGDKVFLETWVKVENWRDKKWILLISATTRKEY